jgi:hypothetical protein
MMASDRQLWTTVLELAIADALGRSSFNAVDYRRDGQFYDPREEAREWIEEAGLDFREVCLLAGLDPNAVRERVLAGHVGRLETTVRTRRPSRSRRTGMAGSPPCLKRAA